MAAPESLISTSVDFEQDGTAHGVLKTPYSSDRSAYGYIATPIFVAKHGDGPTLLITGGNHGDEYEGPIAIMRLMHEGAFQHVNGRVIVIPALNYPAYRAGTRTSPIDRVNLNRAFPGKRDGTVTEMLAHYIETVLLPKVNYVLDIHSGGTSLNYLPTVITSPAVSPEDGRKKELLVRWFKAPRWLEMDLLADGRMIGAAAHRNGAIFMAGEFGGGATVSPDGVRLVVDGIKGVLAGLGITRGQVTGDAAVDHVEVKREHYVYATRAGIFDPAFLLGDVVKKGQLAGRIFDQEEPWKEPVSLQFESEGLVICVRTLAMVEAGDCVAHLARNVER
jgi:predicted deacylase